MTVWSALSWFLRQPEFTLSSETQNKLDPHRKPSTPWLVPIFCENRQGPRRGCRCGIRPAQGPGHGGARAQGSAMGQSDSAVFRSRGNTRRPLYARHRRRVTAFRRPLMPGEGPLTPAPATPNTAPPAPSAARLSRHGNGSARRAPPRKFRRRAPETAAAECRTNASRAR